MGSTGAGSYTGLYPTLLNNLIGTKFKIVSGYKSTNEIHIAMERGEVQGRAGNLFSSLMSQNRDWVDDNHSRERFLAAFRGLAAELGVAWPGR